MELASGNISRTRLRRSASVMASISIFALSKLAASFHIRIARGSMSSPQLQDEFVLDFDHQMVGSGMKRPGRLSRCRSLLNDLRQAIQPDRFFRRYRVTRSSGRAIFIFSIPALVTWLP
jgi:hypothetical protein